MKDFFIRTIERTMGISETVQPLAVPIYSVFSFGPSPLNNKDMENPTTEVSGKEAPNILLKQAFRINDDKEIQNSDSEPGELSMDESGDEREPGKEYRLEREYDISEPAKTFKEVINNSEIVNKDKVNQIKNNKREKEDTAVISAENILFDGSGKIHFIKASSVHKEDKRAIESIPALLPESFKEEIYSERSGIAKTVKHDKFDNTVKDQKPGPIIPTVKVTIGRVEVRAVMQQVHKTKVREQAKPKLTLDDYLRQRMEGKR
jgi:hypothetical protein